MRISFRTTLEQELVDMLKNMAKEKNKNMNDILEELLYFYYGDTQQVTYFVPQMPDNYVGGKTQFLQNEISYISAKIFERNGVVVSEDFLKVLETVALLMTELAIRDEQLSKKNDGNVSTDEIIKNADEIKRVLENSLKK